MKYILFCLFLFWFTSCRKTYDNTNQTSKIVLPAYSETGANTFGFMLNNTPWTVFGKYYFRNGVSSSWIDNGFEVSVFNAGGGNQLSVVGGGRMTIVKNDSAITDVSAGFSFVPTIPFTKNYSLTGGYPGHFAIVDRSTDKYYKIDLLRPFTLQLTKFEKIDTLNRICSGRFYGTLYNEVNHSDSIVVTDGRFDTKVIYR